MTDDAPESGHEDELAPPASTRWTEEAVPDDDGSAPPFVPGRAAPASRAASQQAPQPTAGPLTEPAPEPPAERAEGPPEPAVEEQSEPFPFDQFDIEGGAGAEEPAAVGAPAAEPEADGDTGEARADAGVHADWSPADLGPEEEFGNSDIPAEGVAVADGPADEVAALLERLARLLREEGADAVRREMDSPDRLTSLLAGILAGYVSGRS